MDAVRIDKWLWAARMFKHRSKATAACGAGHVSIDGVTSKASKKIGPGVTVELVTPDGKRVLEVVALADRRGPAPEAQKLYVDHSPPPAPPDPWMQIERGAGRPTKRDRRRLERIKKGEW